MQIVINISEESYKNIKEQVDKRDYPDMSTGKAIANGTPLTEDNDTISRKAVVELVAMQMIYSGKFDGTKVTSVRELLEDINNLPNAIPTRQKAKWIMTGEREELYCEMARCSSCGGETINNGVDKFCPDCGAEMESD